MPFNRNLDDMTGKNNEGVRVEKSHVVLPNGDLMKTIHTRIAKTSPAYPQALQSFKAAVNEANQMQYTQKARESGEYWLKNGY